MIDLERTVLLGVRKLDELEKALVRRSGVQVFTMKDIDRDGIASVAQRALEIVGGGKAPIHVSLGKV